MNDSQQDDVKEEVALDTLPRVPVVDAPLAKDIPPRPKGTIWHHGRWIKATKAYADKHQKKKRRK